ncbi:MAG: hypothetical protein KAI64_05670, partial [Thermoplasmata archaeon]|nr:hypothetical protein [Thermoplasmata archaeon]
IIYQNIITAGIVEYKGFWERLRGGTFSQDCFIIDVLSWLNASVLHEIVFFCYIVPVFVVSRSGEVHEHEIY